MQVSFDIVAAALSARFLLPILRAGSHPKHSRYNRNAESKAHRKFLPLRVTYSKNDNQHDESEAETLNLETLNRSITRLSHAQILCRVVFLRSAK